ncbi:IS30 family transposase ISPlu1 [subsurface metagenome]
MGMLYNQLTKVERNQIYVLLQEDVSFCRIAEILERSPSTISREINRNRGQRGYRPKQAERWAQERRKTPRIVKMIPEVIAYIEKKLHEEYSPEQISCTMGGIVGDRVSHERIYQHILHDKKHGGDLYRKLRIAGKKKRRKRYGKKDWRGKIPNRVDIDQRPAIVEEKTRIGDWEADLVSGTRHRGFLVTLVERKSKYTLIGHVKQKIAADVTTEILRLLTPHKKWVKTITYDNGREFSAHELINKGLNCQSYFAKPYHSWERGLNENTNGLIRQYFPKGMDLREVSGKEINFVMMRLNRRPRKTLEFKPPHDVFVKCESKG